MPDQMPCLTNVGARGHRYLQSSAETLKLRLFFSEVRIQVQGQEANGTIVYLSEGTLERRLFLVEVQGLVQEVSSMAVLLMQGKVEAEHDLGLSLHWSLPSRTVCSCLCS